MGAARAGPAWGTAPTRAYGHLPVTVAIPMTAGLNCWRR